MLLTSKCNFSCEYCKGSRYNYEISLEKAKQTLLLMRLHGLQNVRFSGGEPTLYRELDRLIGYAKLVLEIDKVCISTNGSMGSSYFKGLVRNGLDQASISLDSMNRQRMSSITKGDFFDSVLDTIVYLSSCIEVKLSVVLTENNMLDILDIVKFAKKENIKDIKIMTPSYLGDRLRYREIKELENVVEDFPILKYRVRESRCNNLLRGLKDGDNKKCPLVIDEVTVVGENHYPCVTYFREGGAILSEDF